VVAVLAAALNVIEPLPPPFALLTVNQAALLAAVHAQPPGAVTAIVPVPPVPATEALVGVTPNVHGTPGCVIVIG
jgi:hypothetical protein